MIEDYVTLILGAGASSPYGFPLGETLKRNIINQILHSHSLHDTAKSLLDHLLEFGYSDQKFIKDFASQLRLSHQPSIDAFLEARPEFIEVGKDSLAATLMVNERIDDLMHKDLANETGKWYDYFVNLLGNREEFRHNNVSVITFNYDRSLEYFLFNSVKARFGLSDAEAAEFASSIPIVHVYGQLGRPHFFDSTGRDYSVVIDRENLVKCAAGIKIMHESLDTTPELEQARKLISKSRILIFLGFGYLRKNIERLLAGGIFSGEIIAGTFYKREEGEIARDVELIRLHTGIGVNSKSLEKYTDDTLMFLRKTNFLR